MAKRYVLVDDLTGKEDDTVEENVMFALYDQAYSLDLSKTSKEKLEKALEPFVSKCPPERVKGWYHTRGAGVIANASKTPTSPEMKAWTHRVRTWALDFKPGGETPSDRGRLSKKIVDAYTKAHPYDAEPIAHD